MVFSKDKKRDLGFGSIVCYSPVIILESGHIINGSSCWWTPATKKAIEALKRRAQ